MCNSYYNYPNYCCTSPASHNCNRIRNCCIETFRCYKPPLEPLCTKDVGNYDQSEKCRGRKMCPGLSNETIKDVLTRPKPVCPIPNKLELDFPLLATFNENGELIETSDGRRINDDPYSWGSEGSVDDPDARFIKKLNENLHTCSAAERKALKASQNHKLDELVNEVNTWYVKEMKEARKREFEKYYLPGASINLRQKSKIKKNAALGLPHVDSATFFGPVLYIPPEDDALESHDEDDLVGIEVADPYRPLSMIQNDDDTLTIGEMRALLKQVKNNPKRPILFHAPFDRNNIWSWKNYDPLTDVPSMLKKQQQKKSKEQPKEYSPWTMNVVEGILKGDPVTDKKLKSNKELRGLVYELANEIKRRQTPIGELLRLPRSNARKPGHSKH